MSKILIVTYEELDLFIGLNTRVRGLVNALVAKGHHVSLVAPLYGQYTNENQMEASEVYNIRMPNFFSFNIPVISRILFFLVFTLKSSYFFCKNRKTFSFDIVQSEQVYPMWAAFLIGRFFSSKLILDDPTMLEMLVNNKLSSSLGMRKIVSFFVRLFEYVSLLRADVVFCSSIKSQQYFSCWSDKIMAKSQYLPNGVDTNEFCVAQKSYTNKIYFNCSLPYYQNKAALDNLLFIFDTIKTSWNVNITLDLIINKPGLLTAVQREIIEKYSDCIAVFSNVPTLVPYIQAADIVLLPYAPGHSLTAGPRLKGIEALACGKLVISTREGLDGVDGCEDAHNCIFVKDNKEMINVICSVLSERMYRGVSLDNIRRGARTLVEDRYSWQSLVLKYDEL